MTDLLDRFKPITSEFVSLFEQLEEPAQKSNLLMNQRTLVTLYSMSIFAYSPQERCFIATILQYTVFLSCHINSVKYNFCDSDSLRTLKRVRIHLCAFTIMVSKCIPSSNI